MNWKPISEVNKTFDYKLLLGWYERDEFRWCAGYWIDWTFTTTQDHELGLPKESRWEDINGFHIIPEYYCNIIEPIKYDKQREL